MPTPQDPSWTLDDAGRLLRSLPNSPFEPRNVTALGRGWDADVFLVDDGWVLRLPRNTEASEGFERELAVSAWLAPFLPLPIPRPLFDGPCGIADWRFVLSPLIPGTTITDAVLSRPKRAALAKNLGEWVAALHAIDPRSAPVVVAPDPYDRFDVQARLPKALESLEQLRVGEVLPEKVHAVLLRLLEAGPPAHPSPPRHCLVHADLHRRNLLVDAAGDLCGVIDWVDLHSGERATDLSTLFTVLPPEARDVFLTAYGEVSEVELGRARWRAAVHMTLALQGSLERSDSRFAESCRSALLEIVE